MIKQILLSLLAVVAGLLVFEATNLDLGIQSYLYDSELNQWMVDRNNYLLKFIFYDGVKLVYLLSIASIFISLVFFRHNIRVIEYKQGLLIVGISLILIPLLVGILKVVTNVPCPRDLQIFQGIYPYVTLIDSYPASFDQVSRAQCFPAGHASGGFAFMSLFFLFKDKNHRITALLCALSIGWIIGSYKTLIGDHFVSHTMVSMIFSWMICSFVALLLERFSTHHRSIHANAQLRPTLLSFNKYPGYRSG